MEGNIWDEMMIRGKDMQGIDRIRFKLTIFLYYISLYIFGREVDKDDNRLRYYIALANYKLIALMCPKEIKHLMVG